jgi:hypothetical protein
MIEEILGPIDKAVLTRLMLKIMNHTRYKSKDTLEIDDTLVDRKLDKWKIKITVERQYE